MTKVAVILSGCGYLDGAEIRESVLSLLYLDEMGAEVSIFAPDVEQRDVMDHITGKPQDEKRNVLVEAARIARGKIAPLVQLNAEDFDALVIPGGFGVAKNLSDFALKGPEAEILPVFQKAIHDFEEAGKPIGAICISPAVLVAASKGDRLKVTIGEDAGVASAIEALGGIHENAATDAVVIDDTNMVASCSAYMRDDAPIADVAAGIRKVIEQVLRMSDKQKKVA